MKNKIDILIEEKESIINDAYDRIINLNRQDLIKAHSLVQILKSEVEELKNKKKEL